MLKFRAYVLFVVGLLVLSATGCQFSGGGHLPSLIGDFEGTPGKATFAMHGIVDGDAEVIAGNGQYNDHALKLKFHLDVTDEVDCDPDDLEDAFQFLIECIAFIDPDLDEEDIEGAALAVGNYRPQPKKTGPGGCFVAVVVDAGEPGKGGDILAIALLDGVYSGYFNCGVIEGGNIHAEILP